MTDPIGTYTFLPWLRRGIANRIGAGGSIGTTRAGIDVEVTIEGVGRDGGAPTESAQQHVELYGPGDIVGLDATAISRVEPQHWTTNFEPNYLPAIEFYDEDLPWRYTPAAPVGRRLSPWLALIALTEEEFREGGVVSGRPLAHIEMLVDLADVAPPASELWAWAHVHFNEALSPTDVVSTDTAAVVAAASASLAANPDLAYSRLLCPRKLAPSTAYHAFVIPAFESGRLAGLGLDPGPIMADPANGLEATSSSWGTYAAKPSPTHVPVYHRWYFHTGTRGDFEELVRILEPRIVDSRVGARDVDVADPAPNLDGISGPDGDGVLRFGGALRAPLETLPPAEEDEYHRFDQWAEPFPHEFQQQLAAFLNLPDSYADQGATANTSPDLSDEVNVDPDPVVVPPIYGRWHALTERLLTERDGTPRDDRLNWLHDLNLDPRWRTAAGFGTTVIQDNQEAYMDAAWDQIGAVLEANRRIRQAQLASRTSLKWHRELAGAASPADALTLHAPIHRRVVSDGITISHRVATSPVGAALVSTTTRRTLRPRGRLAAGFALGGVRPMAEIVERVNRGEIVTAPEKPVPEVATPDDVAAGIAPGGLLGGLARLLRRLGWLGALALVVLLALLVLVLVLSDFATVAVVVAAVVIVGLLLLVLALRGAFARLDAAESIGEEGQTPESVDQLPGHAGFGLVTPISLLGPHPVEPEAPTGADNPVSIRFKKALRDDYTLTEVSEAAGQRPVLTPLDLDAVATDLTTKTDPLKTVPASVFNGITLPPRVVEAIGERFVEAMAYPELDIPMYRPLVDMSVDGFVPNLHLVEPNSVTLLETNQRFIESYMVGINHEFARELLWREYPTDQRGSYFRQFWDVRTQLITEPDPEAAREALKDIPPIHLWSRTSDLGDHDHREAGRENEEELVLVIRGELLKKYPNTVVSAQRARWQPVSDTDPTPDKALERRLDEESEILMPLYEARVPPDIYFFGFDLTAVEARGDDTVDDKPGWFFRIEEVPGDARFGFDTGREGDLNVYNDLAWPDVVPGVADGMLVTVAEIPNHTLVEPTEPEVEEKHEQWESDRQVPLDADVSAAELAYIALQTPVLMAVHASELLPDQPEP